MPRRIPGSRALTGRLPRSRRGVLTGAAAALASLLLPDSWFPQARAAAPAAPKPLTVPPWDAVPLCTPSRTDRAGQGPFYIHNGERDDDIDMFRQDIRGRYNVAAEPGTEMHLHLRVLNAADAECGATPVAGVEVYVWHVDGQGFYSGFGEPGEQTPDLPYRFTPGPNDLKNNTRFCRGIGVTDANGVVSFRSIFPGWYNGRDLHIHTMVLKRDSKPRARINYRGDDHLYTTQLYFEPDLIDRVHKASEPYLRRTQLPAYAGTILGDERGASGLRFKADFTGGLVTAQMQMVLDPNQSRV
jgi:protocatechuate 3,4-dioxygenase beta subunit